MVDYIVAAHMHSSCRILAASQQFYFFHVAGENDQVNIDRAEKVDLCHSRQITIHDPRRNDFMSKTSARVPGRRQQELSMNDCSSTGTTEG